MLRQHREEQEMAKFMVCTISAIFYLKHLFSIIYVVKR